MGTRCANCHWDFESRKKYAICCLNCEKNYCDSCHSCGIKCKKNNIDYLFTDKDPEFSFELRNGYGYDTHFDFKECILCTSDMQFMKIRTIDKYNLLLCHFKIEDDYVDQLVRNEFHQERILKF